MPRMDQLAARARDLFNLRLTDAQLVALSTYERELLDWNTKFNLTALAIPPPFVPNISWIRFRAPWPGATDRRVAWLTWERARASRVCRSRSSIPACA